MNWFVNQKLNVKFTVVIGLIIIIPIIVIYQILFNNLKSTTVKQVENTAEETMVQTYSEIQKTVDLCNMSSQMFLNNQKLNEVLAGLKRGEHMETEELVSFYQNDIAMLERLVNSNPYLYRIRVYAESNDFLEMMPILYRHERMETLAWADTYVSGQWQFDYEDSGVGSLSTRSREHIMSLVTSFTD